MDFEYFCGVKWWFYIGIVLMAVMVGCKPPTTSPLPSPGGEGVASRTLENIDSLMWRQPDSALTVMLEFAGSAEADSLDEFNGHYCQVMVAELLYKNDYGQSNREELLEAVSYFDSLIIADERSESEQDRNAFLDARAHYINGVGYAEKDSVVEACGEYLCALRTMESHYPENELVGTKVRFMVLVYNRLVDLFSNQYMLESVIICCKQALHYDAIEPLSPTNRANVLYRIGTHYDMLKEADSAAFYYEAAMKAMTGRNSMVYRDLISSMAYHEYSIHHDTVNSLDSLKRMVTLSVDERERLVRFLTIGAIYHDMEQYDSAKVYLEPVLENSPDKAEIAAGFLRDIAISEADTLKTEQYARLLVKDASKEVESQARVSKLNDMFQSYLLEKQEAASVRARKEDVKKATRIIVPMAILMALAIIVFAKLRSRKLLKEQQAVAQKELDDRDRQHKDAVKKQQEEAIQQARMMLPQRVNDLYRSKVSNRMERILEEFEAAYPYALERLAAAYPDLNKTETYLVVLSFLQFRAKEEADLLGLSENTVMQYRSNLRKKTANASFSEFFS